MIPTHQGQHGPDCYGCKLQSLSFDRGGHKVHVQNGSPWEGNPVVERIAELTGETVDTDALNRATREAHEPSKGN